MATGYFEEMIEDAKGIKRNFCIDVHFNSVLINIGDPGLENDVAFQLVVDKKQFLRLLEAMQNAAHYQCWLKK